ncbi:uncharacterized protein LOC143288098 isoform X2 [Babylonia areolata]|uniref:uncharacterized protein LOC143288098 isoform X2 n=1 Tax=Babylonia areolata TaxID=304850 RepID=UPI003FCF227A
MAGCGQASAGPTCDPGPRGDDVWGSGGMVHPALCFGDCDGGHVQVSHGGLCPDGCGAAPSGVSLAQLGVAGVQHQPAEAHLHASAAPDQEQAQEDYLGSAEHRWLLLPTCPVAVTAHLLFVIIKDKHGSWCNWTCVLVAMGAGDLLQVANSSINFLFYFLFASRFRPLLQHAMRFSLFRHRVRGRKSSTTSSVLHPTSDSGSSTYTSSICRQESKEEPLQDPLEEPTQKPIEAASCV